MKKLVSIAISIVIAIGIVIIPKGQQNIVKADSTEMRAAWISTVYNIDWPSDSSKGNPELQKRQYIELLDKLKEAGINTAVVQVRPESDSLYRSKINPWSRFLTGTQGKDPGYDPLAFIIQESHKRNIKVHAWFNPYRASIYPDKSRSAANNPLNQHPDWTIKHNNKWYYDPGNPEVNKYIVDTVAEVVSNYDVDGIHFDDYFYPYESYNGGKDFPDDVSWAQYQKDGGKLSRNDWRRESVNVFIQKVYAGIKDVKEDVKFGLSPFGIWRPGYPSSIAGMDQYNTLYADAKLWLNEGWVDYFSPQLYWPINRIAQSFPVLLNWWQEENTHQRHLWPGINVAAGGRGEDGADEVENQIMISRGITPKSPGVVHWSISPLLRNDSLKMRLKRGTYKDQALVPVTDWLSTMTLGKPNVRIERSAHNVNVNWNAPKKGEAFQTIVYYQYGNRWSYQILGEKFTSLRLDGQTKDGKLQAVQVGYIDKNSRIGELATPKL